MVQTTIIFIAIFIALGLVLTKGIKKTFSFIGNLIVKGIIGVLLLYVLNVIGAQKGIHVPINEATASISALLGIPGIIALVVIQTYLGL